jgi:hypothetical protein
MGLRAWPESPFLSILNCVCLCVFHFEIAVCPEWGAKCVCALINIWIGVMMNQMMIDDGRGGDGLHANSVQKSIL